MSQAEHQWLMTICFFVVVIGILAFIVHVLHFAEKQRQREIETKMTAKLRRLVEAQGQRADTRQEYERLAASLSEKVSKAASNRRLQAMIDLARKLRDFDVELMTLENEIQALKRKM